MVDVVFGLIPTCRAGSNPAGGRAERAAGLQIADRAYILRTGTVIEPGPAPSSPPRPTCSRRTSARRAGAVPEAPAGEPARPDDRRRPGRGQHLRPARPGYLAHLRRHAPCQLRPRRTHHGRRVRDLRTVPPRRQLVVDGPSSSSAAPPSPSVATELVAFRWVRNSSPSRCCSPPSPWRASPRAVADLRVAEQRQFPQPGWVNAVQDADISFEVMDVVTIAVTALTLVLTASSSNARCSACSVRGAAEDFDAARLMGVRADATSSPGRSPSPASWPGCGRLPDAAARPAEPSMGADCAAEGRHRRGHRRPGQLLRRGRRRPRARSARDAPRAYLPGDWRD